MLIYEIALQTLEKTDAQRLAFWNKRFKTEKRTGPSENDHSKKYKLYAQWDSLLGCEHRKDGFIPPVRKPQKSARKILHENNSNFCSTTSRNREFNKMGLVWKWNQPYLVNVKGGITNFQNWLALKQLKGKQESE